MLRIADKTFESHLFTGTGKFAAPEVMVEAIRASGSQLVTLAMKRVDLRQRNDAILAPLLAAGVSLLPNTSGAKTAEEAVFAARLAREALGTHWLKLEIHPDARWLLPTRLNPESGGAAGPRRVRGAALLRRRSGAV
ncbi:thiazole biosynthesis protein ThiG [Klebsiella pneumoniae subsp. pneumoniae]|uniref:thiazole synthase n=1 Tax=Klebsiella pneumoniae subsp. pneumoniae TaxID=72407 RepID=A0A378AQS4_KLEPN|nr:thiazole biosynthesis protein ThiG [Klebsiella pneumoniae subsp. pneumoniae]